MGSMDVALCYDDLLAAAATGRSRRLLCRSVRRMRLSIARRVQTTVEQVRPSSAAQAADYPDVAVPGRGPP
jgi:hypothetical protein